MPEYNVDTRKSDKDRKEFFKDLSIFNNKATDELLSSVDTTLKAPVYSKRLDKYQKDRTQPFLLTFDDPINIKTIFKNLLELKFIPDLEHIVIKYDLTPTQRAKVRELRVQCDRFNSNLNNNESNYSWSISDSNSIPTLVQIQKNTVPFPQNQSHPAN